MEEIDVMVLTSVSEGLPFVIIESFAAGVPVVSTDVGSCRELIEGKGDGLGMAGGVIPIGDPQAAAALLPLLQDAELRETMGEAGHARVAANYDQRQVVRRCRAARGGDPVGKLEPALELAWGNGNRVREVRWQLYLRVGRATSG